MSAKRDDTTAETTGQTIRRPTVDDVRNYWDQHPLLSHELKAPGTPEFFAGLDRAKREDSERFALDFWEFNSWKGRRVLDVGCGPGWVTVQYALGGANVDSVDLSPRTVEIARQHAALANAQARIQVGNAEQLPFSDGEFDLVVSSGVLHHTPDTPATFRECARVLRPGGKAKITLYRKGLAHHRLVFPLARLAMRLVGMRHPGADMAKDSHDVDDFIRQYDGADNPVGIGYTDAEWAGLLKKAGFEVISKEVHYFPRRFLPRAHLVPAWVHRWLDRGLGTMVYFNLRKA